ncbi:hypothetical protein SAMN05444164_7020 [Bradyrhizobium erythrophlei]|uniref:Uncharacterized protein n=2 Tax=Bradyrhizobium erythrophlei TaxID=1437360 RepID=A0A1H5GBD5_9BRAD|nr:hypothetical protein SAMN05444164_7020 [Bradyrhizobium erythrophlei]
MFTRARECSFTASRVTSWRPSSHASSHPRCQPRQWPRSTQVASKMRTATSLLAAAIALGWSFGTTAAPVAPRDPPWSAERIDRLPLEVRRVVVARCGADAEAGHYFATYEHDSNVIHLDYSLLYCPTASNREMTHALRQTFVKRQGGYALSEVEFDRAIDPSHLSPISRWSARRSGAHDGRPAFAER